MYPENVICSHIPYGHFGSGDLTIHVSMIIFTKTDFGPTKNNRLTMFHRNIFSKIVSASGEMMPTPRGSIFHRYIRSGHGCHVTGGEEGGGGVGGRGAGGTQVSPFGNQKTAIGHVIRITPS